MGLAFTEVASLPQPREAIDAATDGNVVSIAGGWNSNNSTTHNEIFQYDIANNSWSTWEWLDEHVKQACHGYTNGTWYTSGGRNENNTAIKKVWKGADTFGVNPLPYTLFGGSGAGTPDGYVHMAGRTDGGSNRAAGHIYFSDGTSGQADVDSARDYLISSAVDENSNAYHLGGEGQYGSVNKFVYKIDVANQTGGNTVVTTAPRGRYYHFSWYLDGYIYYAGGFSTNETGRSKSIDRYDLSTDSWTTLSDTLPYEFGLDRAGAIGVPNKNEAYIIGGNNGYGTQSTVYRVERETKPSAPSALSATDV